MSNALPEPDRSRPHSGSYTSAVPDHTCPLLLGLAQSCSLHFGFPMQQCAQPLNSWCAVVKISPTSKPSLFCPDQRGEPVVTVSRKAVLVLQLANSKPMDIRQHQIDREKVEERGRASKGWVWQQDACQWEAKATIEERTVGTHECTFGVTELLVVESLE